MLYHEKYLLNPAVPVFPQNPPISDDLMGDQGVKIRQVPAFLVRDDVLQIDQSKLTEKIDVTR